MRASRRLALVLAAFGTPAVTARAQHAHAGPADSSRRVQLGAMAIGVYSYSAPGPFKVRTSEGYLTQPMAMGRYRSSNSRFVALATINAEGATLQRGEINPGVYGEGYVDRRHPHTWAHEVMAGVVARPRGGRLALFAGKGFVPFGTDDPMVRPLVKYPVNHHHAQILERVMVVGGIEVRRLSLEVASFNGDEPESTTDWPNRDRLFDSWASRLTLTPVSAMELSASMARVESPEFAAGFGLDQRKHSAAARWSAPGRIGYALLEYARTQEYSGARKAFDFDSWLGEVTVNLPGAALSLRAERTARPEEERDGSFFRTVRPHHDFNILGRTRWTNLSVNVSGTPRGWRWLAGRPFVEAGYHVPRATIRPTPLDPVDFFGARRIWMVSGGFRLHAGTMRPRFGRYGLSATE